MFIDFLKDYMDHIRSIEFSFYRDVDLSTWINAIKGFIWYSLSLSFNYIVTFQWMHNIIELPILAKETFSMIINQHTVLEPWKEFITLEPNFYSVNDQPTTTNYTGIITGWFNGLVVAIPCSVGHIYACRLFLINGLTGGIAAISGTVLGQLLFFASVLLGLESLVTPFLNYEIVMLFLGMVFLGFVIADMMSQPNFYDFGLKKNKHQGFKSFAVALILGWLEKGCVFTFVGDLTVTHSNHMLQGASNNFFFGNVLYLVGLIVGSIFWTALVGFVFVKLTYFFSDCLFKAMPKLMVSQVQKITHMITVCIMTVFCFNSIPYYGLDYLLTGPLGFVYQDRGSQVARSQPYYLMLAGVQIDNVNHSTGETFRLMEDPYDGFLYGNPTFDDEFWMPYASLSLSLDVESYKNTFEFDLQNIELAQYLDPEEIDDDDPTLGRYETTTIDRQFELEDEPINVPPRTLLDNYHNIDAEKYGRRKKGDNRGGTMQQRNQMETLLKKVFRLDNDCKQIDFLTALPYELYGDNISEVVDARLEDEYRYRYTHSALYKILSTINFHLIISPGQLPSTKLTHDDELNLARSRAILHRYVNSIRTYRKGLTNRTMVEKVYNQQFKGDIDYIRRFDEITVDYDRFELFLGQFNENKGKKVLKYDIPKYNERQNENSVFMHEELSKHYNEQRQNYIATMRKKPLKYLRKNKQYGIRFFRSVRKKPKQAIVTDEEIKQLDNQQMTLALNKRTDMIYQRLLLLNDTAPLYIGWDNQLHKFLIKTPTLPTKLNTANVTDPVDPGSYDVTDFSDDDTLEDEITSNLISEPNEQNQTPTDKMPNYYHIEAWSPAIKNAKVSSTERILKSQRIFKLPFTTLTKKEEMDIRKLIDLIPKSSQDMKDFKMDPVKGTKGIKDRGYHVLKWLFEGDTFKRLPNYNWYWLEYDPILQMDEPQPSELEYVKDDFSYKSLHLSDVLPPKLDGFAWPGVMDPGIAFLIQDNLRDTLYDSLYTLFYVSD